VRPPAAARTLDFIEARFEIYLALETRRFLDKLRRRTRIFLGCIRRKTFDRQLHTYVVCSQVPPRFILCGTFSARRRDTDSSSLQKPVLFSWLSCCCDGPAFATLPRRLPTRSFCLSPARPLKYSIACQSQDLLGFFLCFNTLKHFVGNSQFNTLDYINPINVICHLF